jgi:hypothetical protein
VILRIPVSLERGVVKNKQIKTFLTIVAIIFAVTTIAPAFVQMFSLDTEGQKQKGFADQAEANLKKTEGR